MNEPLCATLLAEDLSTISGLTFFAAGAEGLAEKPYGVVRFENFVENQTLLGNYDGQISVNLRSVPEDTNAAEVSAWSDEITSRIVSTDSLDAALDGKYSAAECWNVQSQTSSISDGIRETLITVSCSLVQLS